MRKVLVIMIFHNVKEGVLKKPIIYEGLDAVGSSLTFLLIFAFSLKFPSFSLFIFHYCIPPYEVQMGIWSYANK